MTSSLHSPVQRELELVDQGARLLLPDSHDFAQLSDGRCHYRIDGAPAGRPLLLIHGATMSSWQFDRVVPHLAVAGFRTIRLDLYGHGYSDRPTISHDYDLFGRQVSELLELLDLRHEINLLGYSLGAAIGARLVQASPCRFGSLIMAAPLLDFFAIQPSAKLPSTECREIDGTSHSMLLTHPHRVASEVLGFLKLR